MSTDQQAQGSRQQAPEERPRRVLKSFWAHVFDSSSGKEAWNGSVHAADLKQAEQFALAKASLATRDHPALLEVRRLHEMCPTCGQRIETMGEGGRA